jgi:hypothetical protein
MLFEYTKLPETGSLIPSISTGGFKIKPRMNDTVAKPNTGNIIPPNEPINNL